MPSHAEIIERLTNPGLIPVIRTKTPEDVLSICDALVAGGATALEITMTIPGVLDCLKQVTKRFASVAVTGAGSVTTPQMCHAAIDAGSAFVVTPIMRPEIAQVAKQLDKAVILGAFTATEAQLAYEGGADFVKIFPSEKPGYVKAIRGPLPHLKIVPAGGVSLQSIPEFVSAGCAALAVGSSLISDEIVRDKNWPELTRLTTIFIKRIQQARDRFQEDARTRKAGRNVRQTAKSASRTC